MRILHEPQRRRDTEVWTSASSHAVIVPSVEQARIRRVFSSSLCLCASVVDHPGSRRRRVGLAAWPPSAGVRLCKPAHWRRAASATPTRTAGVLPAPHDAPAGGRCSPLTRRTNRTPIPPAPPPRRMQSEPARSSCGPRESTGRIDKKEQPPKAPVAGLRRGSERRRSAAREFSLVSTPGGASGSRVPTVFVSGC